MAYHDSRDKEKSVCEIQRMLRDLSYIENNVAKFPINGQYGEGTREAIKEFQTLYGLAVTGIVNYKTWQLLKAVHKMQTSDVSLPRAVHILPKYSEYELVPGVRDNIIFLIQHMLESILALNYDYDEIELNGIYDEATVHGLKLFQRANLLEDTGVINTETLNKLADEYERVNSLRN